MPLETKFWRPPADTLSVKALEIRDDSLLSLVSSEPGRSRFIIKLGAGGAVAITLWTWVASYYLSLLIVLPLTVVFVVLYAATLVFLTGKLVRAADRWQVESALQARRLLAGNAHQPGKAPPSATAGVTAAAVSGPSEFLTAASFHQWYFALRLDEEVLRCRREGAVLSVAVVGVQFPGRDPGPIEQEQMSFDIAKLATDHARTIELPTCIGPSEYAFVLADKAPAEARTVMAPLLRPLGDYACELAISSYPEDGGDAETLIGAARARLEDAAEERAA